MIAQELHPPSIWRWTSDHAGVILSRTAQHVELTVIAVVVGLAISLPLSILAYRHGRLYPPITWITGLLYTIPSLALFVLLIPVTGLRSATVEIGLVSYTLLILTRGIVTALRGIPAEVRESALGLGYAPRQLLWQVEWPLALPLIVASVRVATVTTIGLVTVTALIGQGGLGYLILQGVQRFFSTPLLVGAALSVALAIAADVALVALQRVLTPWVE